MLYPLLAALVVAASLAVLLYLLRLLLNAFQLPSLGRFLERRRLGRLQQRCRAGDRSLGAGNLDRALREFRLAFYLQPILSDRRLLGEVHNHHTGLLSRFIAVSEDVQGGAVRLMSLAKADRLLSERRELQRRYFVLREQPRRDRRIGDIYVKLRENRRDLESCLKQLVEEILASRPVERLH